MNDQINALVTSLFGTLVTHIVQCVVHQITPEINAAIDAKIDAAVSAALDATYGGTAFQSLVRQQVQEYLDAAPLVETAINSAALKKVIDTYVTDYLDDNRTITRMDESIDDMCTRLDDLETAVNEEGTGMSRKLRNEVEGIVQDKLDSSDIITNDNLAGEVERILNSGNFSTSFSV